MYDATKQNFILDAPKILFILLKRFINNKFTGNYEKDSKSFPFPLELDIGKYFKTMTTCAYSLKGIIMHSGSVRGGHATSYAIDRTTGIWHYFNDSSTHETSWEMIKKEAYGQGGTCAYVLVYEQNE